MPNRERGTTATVPVRILTLRSLGTLPLFPRPSICGSFAVNDKWEKRMSWLAQLTRAMLFRFLSGMLSCSRLCPADPRGARRLGPFTFGMNLSQTGGSAPNGKAVLDAMQIWIEDTNAQGGLLGRQVRLITYDDQSNPALVPGIISKLLDVDKVDFLLGGNGTNMIAPALPAAMMRGLTVVGLFGLDVNSEFHYPNYFSMIPAGGEHPKEAFSAPVLRRGRDFVAEADDDRAGGADAEFARNAVDGARAQAKRAGYKIVYDRSYPPATSDYSPIGRAIQSASSDLVFVGSYPPDTVGMVRAVNEVGLNVKLFGGGMVGTQVGSIKSQLGPLLNGIVNYDFWLPVGAYATPEAKAFINEIPGPGRR